MNGTGDSIRNVVTRIATTDFMMVFVYWIFWVERKQALMGAAIWNVNFYFGFNHE